MNNADIAKIFRELGQILEIKGENPFRIRSYYKVAQIIEGLPQDVLDLYKNGELEKIQGVGEGTLKKIEELVSTGKIKAYEELKASLPQGLLDMMRIPDVGPKTVKLVYEELNIKTIDELEKAAKEHKLRNLFRLGPKVEENILKGIDFLKSRKERFPLGIALPIALSIIEIIKSKTKPDRIEYAGSLRRMKETVKDIDLLVTSKNPEKVMEVFTKMDGISEVLAKGDTKSSILYGSDRIQIDLRVVPQESFGAALQYFTGSKEHNIKMRTIAAKKNLKVNEYGVFKENSKKPIAGKTEEEVYEAIGLSWIPPELREDKGEIEAVLAGNLISPVELSDIKADLHTHTNWSDGANTIEEMAEAAIKMGYSYLAVTEHSVSAQYANGLTVERLLKQKKEIESLNKKYKNFKILFGIEADIKSDGSLDYNDSVLSKFDFIVASIHSKMKDTKENMTKRLISAIRNKYVDVIGHPTGRLISQRQGYEIDFDEFFKELLKNKKAVELNSFPDRLDINDVQVSRAVKLGIPIAISTDAHSIFQLEYIRYGVATARRAWAEKKNILNSLNYDELLRWRKNRISGES